MDEFDKSYEILRIIKRLRKVSHKGAQKYFKDLNLTGPQGAVMSILKHHGKMKIGELSEKMSLSNSTVSGIVDRLEKQKYVKRERSEKDRRVVYISSTEIFKEKIGDKMNEMENDFKRLIESGTEEEQNKILEGFKTLSKFIDRVEAFENEER